MVLDVTTIQQQGDLYVDYDYEEVMFRWDHIRKTQYRKFYGEDFEIEVPFNNRLYCDALLFGNEISAGEYRNGKVRDPRKYSKID